MQYFLKNTDVYNSSSNCDFLNLFIHATFQLETNEQQGYNLIVDKITEF